MVLLIQAQHELFQFISGEEFCPEERRGIERINKGCGEEFCPEERRGIERINKGWEKKLRLRERGRKQ